MFSLPSKSNAASIPASNNAKTEQLKGHTVRVPEDVEHLGHHVNGVRLADTDNWLRAGPRGPALLSDFNGLHKISHFNHERIPERVVHARGNAAHGTFKLHTPIPQFSYAPILNDTSITTPTFVRFSTVLGSRGSAETVRDVRGFAVKFYTQEGNWDIVGNNIPVFFIQDGMKFPDLIHAGKPEQTVEMPQAQTAHDNFWDFMGRMPESTHMAAWITSNRTIPRSYRMMEGFGVNSYVLVNAEGKRTFVKFHWKPHLGVHSLVWDEALKLAGQDPDFLRRDLAEAISSGAYPKWELGIQTVAEEDEHNFDFDLLDCTKLIPEELVPIQNIGTLTLDKNPSSFFHETEQVAFCTSNIVPGIDYSNDPMLQIRNQSYHDTQLSRLGGINYHELPINRPVCPFASTARDGYSSHIIPSSANYHPNRFDDTPKVTPPPKGLRQEAVPVSGRTVRARGEKFAEHTDQATLFYNSLTDVEKTQMVDTWTFELGKCTERPVQERVINTIINEIDHDLACKVGANFSIQPPKPEKPNHGRQTKVSMLKDYNTFTAEGRQIALFCLDGYDPIQVNSMATGFAQMGIVVKLVGARKGPHFPRGVKNSDTSASGVLQDVDFTIETCRSTHFDALVFPGGDEDYVKSLNQGRVIHFVREAFGHYKTIAAAGESVPFIAHTCLPGSTDFKADPTQAYSSKNGMVLASSLTEQEAGVIAKLKQGVQTAGFAKGFIDALAIGRHFGRDISTVAF